MGHTIWVDVRGRSEDDVPADNSIMQRLQSELDRLSTKLNVPKLSEFYDFSELEAYYGDFEGGEEDDGPLAEGSPSEGSWYDPEPALKAVRAIHDHLLQHPEDLGFQPDPSRAHWPDGLMGELQDCLAALEDAAVRGQQFRFLIVP
jgi:hypothetical protein